MQAPKRGAKPAPSLAERRQKANQQLLTAARTGSIAEMRRALEAGADINSLDKQGRTALIYSFRLSLGSDADDTTSMRELEASLRRSAEDSARSLTGEIPHATQMLLRAGAQVNIADKAGQTALFYAAAAGNENLSRELLRHKANVNVCSKKGITPLALAVVRHEPEMVELFLKAGADPKAHRVGNSMPLLVLALMRMEPEKNEEENFGTLLGSTMSSMLGGDLEDTMREETVAALLRANLNPNDGVQGVTPLFFAAYSGTPRVVRMLLERGAKVNAAVGDGTTPLAAAASKGRADTARVLLEAGANPNTVDKDGDTPLMLAIDQGSYGMVELLLKAGAKIDTRNKTSQTARERAVALRLPALVRLLDMYTSSPKN